LEAPSIKLNQDIVVVVLGGSKYKIKPIIVVVVLGGYLTVRHCSCFSHFKTFIILVMTAVGYSFVGKPLKDFHN
jgi:hypothetical protein